MNANSDISDEQLNALLDNELDNEDRAQLLNAIQADTELAARYAGLRQVKEMVSFAYAEPAGMSEKPAGQGGFRNLMRNYAAVASLFLFLGAIIGVIVDGDSEMPRPQFESVAGLDLEKLQSEKILLHIGSMESTRVNAVLDTAEKILLKRKSEHKPVELEIVANASGLGILRRGSPYSPKIKKLSRDFNNVSFLACGIAKKTMQLQEGKDIELIPEALDIPAALDRILDRVGRGWVYVRG